MRTITKTVVLPGTNTSPVTLGGGGGGGRQYGSHTPAGGYTAEEPLKELQDPAMRKRQEEIKAEILALKGEQANKENLEVLQTQCAIIGHASWGAGRCRFCGAVA